MSSPSATPPPARAGRARLRWLIAVAAVLLTVASQWLLLPTGTFALVYVVGSAAALKLMPRGTWVRRGAGISFVATLTLLVLTGTHLLGPALIGAGSLIWSWRAQRRARAQAAPAPA